MAAHTREPEERRVQVDERTASYLGEWARRIVCLCRTWELSCVLVQIGRSVFMGTQDA